ncbi:MAG: NYN domain-containing protein [Dehalogenimonas sp.]|uniref:NYN domain-containing protein n=1 Tax=Candidatus Dehalogenimonas loeffleri TaxID=3127115 RepID=A0ABZ2J8J8_9CHLR|nr:NYN domain-containing protein [Dehalogenimonas sp.]
MKTNVYIDGFNLYYGALKYSPFKWLNLAMLCSNLFPNDTINQIRYFTARVKPSPHDLEAPLRQDIYLRALRTLPSLSIYQGRYVQHPTLSAQYPLVYINHPKRHAAVKPVLIDKPEYAYIANGEAKPEGSPVCAYVLKREEKGSDVNLASMLLADCYEDAFDKAVVISNDSDLCMPIELSIRRCGKHITVVNPHDKSYQSVHLKKIATAYMQNINRSVLAASQFPHTLSDSVGTITKPAGW